jgi:hypothetical protein
MESLGSLSTARRNCLRGRRVLPPRGLAGAGLGAILVQILKNSLRVKDGGSCHGSWCATINEDSVTCDKRSVLREIATTMFLLVCLQFLLGILSRTTALCRRLRAICKAASQPLPKSRASGRRAVPHEWISMDYVLTESFHATRCRGRGPFESPTHPLGSILRFVRRLAGVPQLYPARATTVSLANRQSERDRL